MAILAELKPSKRLNLIDLVQEAGHDVAPWSNTKGHPASNPKYCYEWCFYDPSVGHILNLWYEKMTEDGSGITYAGNMRDMLDKAQNPNLDAKSKRAASSRVKRAKLFDAFLKEIHKSSKPFKVIVQSGELRNIDSYESAKAEKRQLDESLWRIKSYNSQNGDYVLVRGSIPFIDQFSAEGKIGSENPEKSEKTSSVYNRDPKVRNAVLIRAKGYCEYCNDMGFQTPNGVYLETHHIIPLSEDGADTVDNVIALCPNDHKMAHYWINKMEMRKELFAAIIAKK